MGKKLISLLTLIILSITVTYAASIHQVARLRVPRNAKVFASHTSSESGWDPTIWDNEQLEEMSNIHDVDVGEKEHDRITYNGHGLPGQPKPASFEQYAGYVKIDKSKGRHLFYYFAEADHLRDTKPLVLWFNGGPGCSSFGYGALQELGPFGVNPDGKTLFSRPYSWNKAANMLFLESPTSVGFSYSNDTSDYDNLGDQNTARDTYKFLLKWLKRFPEYKNRDFYLVGESYAGIYIPQLADLILHENYKAGKPIIKLKGIMMGNPDINDFTDQKGTYDYVWSHGLLSDETHKLIMKNCFENSSNLNSSECSDIKTKGDDEGGDIDPYAIYAPLCRIPENATLPVSPPTPKQGGYDPCVNKYALSYLNLPHVQKALHVKPTKWDLCSSYSKNWKDYTRTMLQVYPRLINSKIKIHIYSGDTDSIVSVTSTRYSLAALNLKVVQPWQPWMDYKNKDVGGYKVVYEGLTFKTIRDAGHQVPQFQAGRAFFVFTEFLGH
ncbi:serine carboxypeptidase 1-like [Impatiens glandulifera]|uniref:serine carboxypeptidase 1-like n=1 Tax=Impatiens glandulifera TaxID=253017 RepID=UPI001FB0DDD6|nr:serine carboxypeptidase 1-like [Impatiens glandulifera]